MNEVRTWLVPCPTSLCCFHSQLPLAANLKILLHSQMRSASVAASLSLSLLRWPTRTPADYTKSQARPNHQRCRLATIFKLTRLNGSLFRAIDFLLFRHSLIFWHIQHDYIERVPLSFDAYKIVALLITRTPPRWHNDLCPPEQLVLT